MDAPTPDQLRARSDLLATRYPHPEPLPDPYTDALATWAQDASALVASLTCRDIGTNTGEEVPDHLIGLAIRAVALKAEQLVMGGGSSKEARRRAQRAGVRSMSAGPLSVTWGAAEDAMKAKQLDPDPAIHEVLWALATDECRAAWLALWEGEVEPAAGVMAWEYGNRPGGY